MTIAMAYHTISFWRSIPVKRDHHTVLTDDPSWQSIFTVANLFLYRHACQAWNRTHYLALPSCDNSEKHYRECINVETKSDSSKHFETKPPLLTSCLEEYHHGDDVDHEDAKTTQAKHVLPNRLILMLFGLGLAIYLVLHNQECTEIALQVAHLGQNDYALGTKIESMEAFQPALVNWLPENASFGFAGEIRRDSTFLSPLCTANPRRSFHLDPTDEWHSSFMEDENLFFIME